MRNIATKMTNNIITATSLATILSYQMMSWKVEAVLITLLQEVVSDIDYFYAIYGSYIGNIAIERNLKLQR
jgi:hypothetical protein